MPEEVRQCFESGAFVCNITGHNMQSVALDEAHEMLINKDIKTTVVRPTKEYLDRILNYFPVRSAALRKLKEQVLFHQPQTEDGSSKYSIFTSSPATAREEEENITVIKQKINETEILTNSASEQSLVNLSGKVATPDQTKDLLNFWQIGKKHFESYIKYFILREPSAQVPPRFTKLLTFSSSKRVQRKVKLIERERKIVNRCMRIAWNTRVGVVEKHSGCQFLELPRAISDPHGMPHKGQKSYSTKWLEKRYTARKVAKPGDVDA